MCKREIFFDKSVYYYINGFINYFDSQIKKFNRISIVMLIFFVIIFQYGFSYSGISCLDDENFLSISIINNIDIPAIVNNNTSIYHFDDQIIVFQIDCCDYHNIKVTVKTDFSESGLKIDTELKSGPQTGFENQFTNGAIYTPINNKFYVTMKIKSIYTTINTIKGKYIFNPSITVEYVD